MGIVAERTEVVPVSVANSPLKARTRIDQILDSRAAIKLSIIQKQVGAALKDLRDCGVHVDVVGSISKGTFRIHSDVDFLVSDRGALPEVQIFSVICDNLRDAPFDLVFVDQLPPENLKLMREDAHLKGL